MNKISTSLLLMALMGVSSVPLDVNRRQIGPANVEVQIFKAPVDLHSVRVASEPEHIQLTIPETGSDLTLVLSAGVRSKVEDEHLTVSGTNRGLVLTPSEGVDSKEGDKMLTISGTVKDHVVVPKVGVVSEAEIFDSIAQQTDTVHNDKVHLLSEEQVTNTGDTESTLKRGMHVDIPEGPSVRVAPEAEHVRLTIPGTDKVHAPPLLGLASKAGYLDSYAQQTDKVHNDRRDLLSEEQVTNAGVTESTLKRGMHADIPEGPSVRVAPEAEHVRLTIPGTDKVHAPPLLGLASKAGYLDSYAQQTDKVHNDRRDLLLEEQVTNTDATESTLRRGIHADIPEGPSVRVAPEVEHVRLTIPGTDKDHASPLLELASKAGYLDSYAQQTDKVHHDKVVLPSEEQFIDTDVAESTLKRRIHVDVPEPPPVLVTGSIGSKVLPTDNKFERQAVFSFA